jgi:hypothetical protein
MCLMSYEWFGDYLELWPDIGPFVDGHKKSETLARVLSLHDLACPRVRPAQQRNGDSRGVWQRW